MAKLKVYMAGLMAVVPPQPGGRGPGRVLMRKTEGEMVDGKPIPLHRARARFQVLGDPVLKTVPLRGGVLRFTPDGQGAFTLRDPGRLLALGDFKGTPVQVKGGCIGGSPDTQCTVGQRPILDGLVELSGGVMTPVLMRGIFSEKMVDPLGGVTVTGAISFDGSGEKQMADQKFANGLLYEREVGEDQVYLILSGLSQQVPLDRQPLAGSPGGKGDTIVWVVNTVADDTPVFADPLESFDRDFDLLYDFAEGAPKRFVPHLGGGAADDPGDPPGKCMPALMHS